MGSGVFGGVRFRGAAHLAEGFSMVDRTHGRRLRDRVRQEPTYTLRHILRTRFVTIVVLVVVGLVALLVAFAVVGLLGG